MGTLRLGYGGWVRWEDPDGTLYVRFDGPNESGRLVIVDLMFSCEDGIAIDRLRALPLKMIEAQVNGPLAEEMYDAMQLPGPNLRLAATAFSTRHMLQANVVDGEVQHYGQNWQNRRGDWVDEMLLSQYEERLTPKVPRAEPRRPVPRAAGPKDLTPPPPEAVALSMKKNRTLRRTPEERPTGVLSVPADQRYSDVGLKEVASVYAGLLEFTRGPAAVIAEANGVNATTARHWVKMAREKGYLARGKRGAAG